MEASDWLWTLLKGTASWKQEEWEGLGQSDGRTVGNGTTSTAEVNGHVQTASRCLEGHQGALWGYRSFERR